MSPLHCHDSGLIVFKLERERPAFAVHQDLLYYIRDKYVQSYNFNTGADLGLLSVRKFGSPYVPPRTLSFNPAERAVLVTISSDNGLYESTSLPQQAQGEVKDSRVNGKKGAGQSGIFVARNRFAVLQKATQIIEVRDLANSVVKTIKPHSTSSVVLYDIQQQKTLAEVNSPPVKYVVWSNNGSLVALMSKHTITIANKNFSQHSLIHETIRIKSGAWDDSGVFITFDPTEYRFKLALLKNNYEEMLIRTSMLLGQSIITYLQQKGFPEILSFILIDLSLDRLHFVQDTNTRFELALECGNLDVAMETAKTIDRPECWDRSSKGTTNHIIVEKAYQQTKNFDKLSFLYLATESTDKLQKIADARGDPMSRFHNALYAGDVLGRISVLRNVALYPLAYLTAKTNGLDELAQEILESAGLTEADVDDVPSFGLSTLKPPSIVTATTDLNWPAVSTGQNFFERALANGSLETGVEPAYVNGDATAGTSSALDAWAKDEEIHDDLDPQGGWEPDADGGEYQAAEPVDDVEEAVAEEADLLGSTPGASEVEHWARNSPLAADHVAAGSFETAMQLLNRQLGIVNFVDLKLLFLSIYCSSHTYLTLIASLPPLQLHIRHNPAETSLSRALPVVVRSLALVSGTLPVHESSVPS
ncbi:coatomer WD associated region-domain-containing protein [Mycena leptocephala]|nr:coatomer WD associated region-domain-containing protein [Mycena leptocephala]